MVYNRFRATGQAAEGEIGCKWLKALLRKNSTIVVTG
jgi:hypothetical protein